MAKAKKGISVTKMVLGVSAVAAAGAYWFYGSEDAGKHRKTARGWMLKARGDVLEAVAAVIEKGGEINKKTYTDIVEGVLKRYSKVVGVTSTEMLQMTHDMKDAWQHMQKTHKGGSVAKAKKTTKKITKKAH
jgi:hypothetical protein